MRPIFIPDHVAIKKVIIGKKLSQQALNRVQKEAEFLRELSYKVKEGPFINYYHNFIDINPETDQYSFYILMEYVDGGDLLELIKKTKQNNMKITEDQIWKFSKAINNGLKILHEK